MDLGSEAIRKHLNNESNYNNAEESMWPANLLIDLLNILRHTNEKTRELELESIESLGERICLL